MPKYHTPWASQNGIVKSIAEVPNGKACGCTCLVCGSAVIAAKNGKIRQPHFRHKSVAECTTSPETFLHYAAKEILERNKYMILPPCRMLVTSKSISFSNDKYNYCPKNARENLNINFDSIVSEKKFSDYIPDLIAHFCGKILIIEIVVTHDIDDDKMRKIEASEADAAIRIYLGDLDRATTTEELEQIILTPSWRTTWVMNKKAVAEAARVKQPEVIEFSKKQKELAEEEELKEAEEWEWEWFGVPTRKMKEEEAQQAKEQAVKNAIEAQKKCDKEEKERKVWAIAEEENINPFAAQRIAWCRENKTRPNPKWEVSHFFTEEEVKDWKPFYGF